MKQLIIALKLMILAAIFSHSFVMAADSVQSKIKKAKTKIDFKPFTAVGTIANYRFSDMINLHPRSTMATDEKGSPLKCGSFIYYKSSRKYVDIFTEERKADWKKVFLQGIEHKVNNARWFDISRNNPYIRLEGVEKGVSPKEHPNSNKRCSFKKLVPIDAQGIEVSMPLPKFSYTLSGKVNPDNTRPPADFEYSQCFGMYFTVMSNNYKKYKDISLLDTCNCVGSETRDFPKDKFKGLSKRQIKNQRIGNVSRYCSDPRTYQ